MSIWIINNLDEVSRKVDPKDFERENVGKLTFKEFKFVNPREDSLPRILREFYKDNVLIKFSLRRGKSFDSVNVILIGGSISSITFESEGKRFRGVKALSELEKRFSQYQSGVLEVYVIEDSLAKIISYMAGLPKKVSEEELETIEVEAPVEVEEKPPPPKPLSLEEVRSEVEELLVATCENYNYKLDSYKFMRIEDYLVLEVKASKPIFKKSKIRREELTKELWENVKPLVEKCGFEKFKLRLRYGLITYEHP